MAGSKIRRGNVSISIILKYSLNNERNKVTNIKYYINQNKPLYTPALFLLLFVNESFFFRVNVTYIDKDGKKTKVRGKVGDNILYLAHRYGIEMEG